MHIKHCYLESVDEEVEAQIIQKNFPRLQRQKATESVFKPRNFQ
jgi:hypothetical protein